MNTISVDEWPGVAGKVKQKRKEQELELQISVIQWADLQAITGKHPELARLFAVPNGGGRSKSEAGKLKASGVRPGVPDLFLPVPRGGHHGLWMELKAGEKSGESAAQKDWLDWLHGQGYFAATCWTFDAAVEVLTEYLDGKHRRVIHVTEGEPTVKTNEGFESDQSVPEEQRPPRQ